MKLPSIANSFPPFLLWKCVKLQPTEAEIQQYNFFVQKLCLSHISKRRHPSRVNTGHLIQVNFLMHGLVFNAINVHTPGYSTLEINGTKYITKYHGTIRRFKVSVQFKAPVSEAFLLEYRKPRKLTGASKTVSNIDLHIHLFTYAWTS